ncbi:MAG: MATE family efflux transporter [Planctomycetota bacterium]
MRQDPAGRVLTREIYQLAWPAALSLLLNNVYRMNDLYWVKGLGEKAQAAVSVAGMVTILAFALYEGLAIGVLSLSARAWGAGLPARARSVFRVALWLSLLAAGTVAFFGFGEMEALLGWVVPASAGAAAPLPERALLRAYLEPVFLGGFFLCLAPVLDHAFIAAKDTRTPLLLQTLAVLANTALNPILIFGLGPVPELGIAGAGWATVLSRVLSTAVGLVLLYRRFPSRAYRDSRSRWSLCFGIVHVGTPAALSIALYSIVYLVMFGSAFATFGSLGRAAMGNGFAVEGLAFCLIWGLATASGSLAGRSLGAGRPEQAEAVILRSLRIVLLMTLPLTLLFLCLPEPLAAFFCTNSAVEREVVIYLKILALSQFAVGLQGVFDLSMMSAGYSLPVSFWSVVWNLSRIPLAIWLAAPEKLDGGLPGIWWAINLSTYGKALTGWWLFRRGRWKRIRV